MKKLLVISDTYSPKRDGVVIFLQQILPLLTDTFEITLLVPDFGSNAHLKNISIVSLPLSKHMKLSTYESASFSFKNRRKIKELIKQNDIIWSQDIALLGALGIIYGKKYKKKVVTFIHQIIWDQMANILTTNHKKRKIISSIAKKIAFYLYKKCNIIILPTEEIELHLKIKTIVVPLGINTKIFAPTLNKNKAKIEALISPQKIVIGYVGRISAEKDLRTLQAAFVELKKKYDIALLIVGGGDKKMEEELKENGAIITGLVQNVVPYLQAMDIFVMPSLTETTSLATMEAMSCGIPIIATPVGKIKEFIQKSFNGYLFPKGDITLLIERLEELILHPEKRTVLGLHARETMQGYDWIKTAEKIKKVLKESL